MNDRNLSYFVYTSDCLTETECDEIIKSSEIDNQFEESKIGDSIHDFSIRKSKTFKLTEQNHTDLILDRLNDCFLEYCEHHLEDLYWSSIQRSTIDGYVFEPLQYTKYDVGNYYNWHVDQGSDTKTICRLLSFVLYLNNDFEGGFTEFAFDKYKPNVGQVLIFPSNFLFPHCGTKVHSGTKKIVTTWINNLGLKNGSN
jgi:hypothetical protein